MSLATSARTAWQGANGAGQVRIFGSLCVLAGGLMLLALFTWGRSGGRGGILAIIRAAGVATDAASDAASDAPTPSEGALPASGTTEGRRRRTARAGVTNRRRDGSSHGSTDSSPADSTPQATAGPAPRRGRKSVDGDAGVAVDHDEVDSHESAFELLKRGHALLHERHNAQAAVVLERAARIETSKGSILEALGRAYFNSGQHARAADTFEALLEVDPSAPYGHFGLGLSFARLGRRQDAKTHLRMAAALDPASETYRRALDKIEATES
jgi:hypothetical protein